ncbi:DUF2244 domain-containing protein [Tibeticola sp.]|jgi:uncharacterized membrane protein|uniref:DUF2244 domain-containing protein n=1 Tax=Tibeticola sp. TaxID=2005368 RepID=UPI002583129C|nr:DUF2244 domain-containing protein [Tibeticola sp.]MCI4441635.1 DUF2244 domain-containing protein [Tibeticola sp.]
MSAAPVLAQSSPKGLEWCLRRNCSITPRQLLWLYASLCVVSGGLSGFFWWHGAPFVAGFAGLELLAVGVAFVCYARHAADRERLVFDGRVLSVEVELAGRVERLEFDRSSVRVDASAAEAGALVVLQARDRSIAIGRHLRPEYRRVLGREIQSALCGQWLGRGVASAV